MGKKGYNWKARQVVNTVIDNSATKKIAVDNIGSGHYDASNELVLPSEKRKTKVKKQHVQTTRILSKKHRKQLEKIVEKKKKKENRQNLLDALSKVQATPEELNGLVSIASVQTKGLKRHFHEEQFPQKVRKVPQSELNILNGDAPINAIKGAAKYLHTNSVNELITQNDPNIVGFDNDSSSEDETESSDDQEDQNQQHQECIEPVLKKQKIDDDSVLQTSHNTNSVSQLPETKPEVKYSDTQVNNVVTDNIKKKPATYVHVARNADIQATRLKLPILAEEQEIMETINDNSVIIIAGETGSGKTTQVPQFLYEAGYGLNGMIGVTEPRRVAAVSMSQRVGEEMNLHEEVSYLIRFEGNVTDKTKIKFMTDGVLLKEIQNDFLLKKYSVIVLDEAHERSVYTDILIGLLSRIVPLRNKKQLPMKLIIMSATLRIEDFTDNRRLFKEPPPVIKVEARQFPVTVHFNKRTNENYLKDAYNKACKIHCRLPEGGILIFVTGQQEVKTLVNKLRSRFPLKHKEKVVKVQKPVVQKNKKNKLKFIPKVDLDEYSLSQEYDLEDNDVDDIECDIEDDFEDEEILESNQPLWVLPLYSLLSSKKQQEVFQNPPLGCRLCVVSTNVAETSLTIPGIKYVVDSGKTKVKLYDKVTGVTSYVINWTSKASADQRAGRAGRTAPGHCYRLYSSAVFNDTFAKFSQPEIQQKPVDDLFLQMKCMNIDKIQNFPFPTAPDLLQLKSANNRLEILGALYEGRPTPLGKAISKFPVLPRYGKMLALSHQHDLLSYTVLLVAALSVQEVLLETPISEKFDVKDVRQKWYATRLQWGGTGNSQLLGDPMVLLRAVGASEYAFQKGNLELFCEQNGLRWKAISEIRKLRHQLSNDIMMNIANVKISVDPYMKPPTDLQAKLLRQILLAGMGDQVARKIQPEEIKNDADKSKYKYAYYAMNMEQPVFLHQGSILKKVLPDFVIYQEIYETNKMYMRGVTAIDVEWLPKLVPHLCTLGEPLTDPEPIYNESLGVVMCTVNGSFGVQNWSIPNCQIQYKDALGAYKWFAKFLLEGKVFPKLEKYRKSLLTVPSTMVKSWANLQPRTDSLLKALMQMQCSTRKKVEEIWEENPKFLLNEYLLWLPQSGHAEVSLLWPPYLK